VFISGSSSKAGYYRAHLTTTFGQFGFQPGRWGGLLGRAIVLEVPPRQIARLPTPTAPASPPAVDPPPTRRCLCRRCRTPWRAVTTRQLMPGVLVMQEAAQRGSLGTVPWRLGLALLASASRPS